MVVTAHVKIADQVWIALAILTREHPERDGFTAKEVREAVGREFGGVSPGVPTHISQMCVATKPPNPGRYRMITKTTDGSNRLFRPGDSYHPDREGAKTRPDPRDVPQEYHELLDWYEAEHAPALKIFGPDAKLLKIEPGDSGLGDIGEHHDRYLNDTWLSRPTRIDRR
ncbi:MAG: hypothetical protein IIC31_02870 [Chloroflexi bacterium]|nr:hypothetical protein [Chloroflexota bacterium]